MLFEEHKEGTATAMVHSGLPEEWWDCGTACCVRKPVSSKDESRLHHLGKKMMTGISIDYVFSCGRRLVSDSQQIERTWESLSPPQSTSKD